MLTESSLDLIATSAFGLESLVRRELETLGYSASITSPGRIEFSGDASAIARSNLWLRTADRVLIKVADFPADNFDDLFEGVRDLGWHTILPADAEFPVTGRSLKSKLTSVPACQRAVKRAIVDSLMQGHGCRVLPETGSLYRVEVALLNDTATLTIDTTGPSLHKRGYRKRTTPAPLKETLAAAMVQLSFWEPERPLIDPFCGSGTIPIEAAWTGLNVAPGSLRTFAAEAWEESDDRPWRNAREEARDCRRSAFDERLLGNDIDSRALEAARVNAEAAGVSDLVHFQQRPFRDLTSKRRFGCVITNPPYGLRLGEHQEWESLYRSMPEVLRRLPTWSVFVLTAYPNFERVVEKTAHRRRKLYNGRIECTYFQFHGPRPNRTRAAMHAGETPRREDAEVGNREPSSEPIRAAPVPLPPAFGGLTEKGREQAELFRRRLQKRARHLRRWPTRQGITCYRLYERDIPEIPLVVDRYDDHLHITEYEWPHERDAGQHADWLDLMMRTAAETLGVESGKTFLKRRRRQRGSVQHEVVSQQRYEIVVQEGGLKFLVNLSDYVDTGLFLDHRTTRSMVRDEARKKRFLNLFAYTGTFSVYAADAPAVETTSVDWSSSYLEWARRNMTLNDFRGAHYFIRSDIMEYLRLQPEKPAFDIAVVDPPTFSNSKRTDSTWEVQRDHAELLSLLHPRMSRGAIVYFSTNYRRFKLDEPSLSGYSVHEITRQTIPEDFRNRRIHRCWRMVVDG